MSNYLTYPFKSMRLTQNYKDGNHAPHINGSPKDYPLDEAGIDGGRDYFYCPCDEVKITKLYGSTPTGYHIWLESTNAVKFANGKTDFVTIFAVHLNEDDYSKLEVGQRFKRGEKIFREGTTGRATGNHTHFAIGLGKSSSTGKYWVQNSKGSWVLVTPNGAIKPENAFFIDPKFTTVKNAKGLKFKELPEEDMSRGYFQKGDKNEGVLALKQMLIQLKSLGVITQGVDNNEVFGEGTEKAVKQVQKVADLEQDGKAGQLTIKACQTLINEAIKAKESTLNKAISNLSKAEKKIQNAQKALK